MARSDGSVIIDTRMNTDGFGKGVKTMKGQINGLSGAVGKLGGVIAAAFAVKEIIRFGKESLKLGSDLQEVQNVVDVTFTTMNEQVNEFAKNAAETAGLSETMAKRYAGTFGAMAKAFGFAESESYNMATALTQLAGDVASFYNLTQDEAYTKLKSVFTGETETLKDLGVVMTQNALDSYAMANGYGKTTKAMSEAEKVALRFAFVTKQLSAASGDFIRTQDSWANQTRILSLNFDSFKANIGQALINIFTPFLQVINQIVAKMAELSARFLSFVQLITGRGSSGGGSPGKALEDIASGYGDVEDATKAAEKAQKSYTSGLDELNIISKDTSGAGAGAGGGIGEIAPLEFPIKPEDTSEANAEMTKTEKILDRIKKRLFELSDLFKKGFFDGLGDPTARFESIKKSIDSIKKSLAGIFDEEFFTEFNNFVDTAVESFGVIAGSMASIGLTIATNLLGGIAGYLESEQGRIKEFFLSMFDIEGAYLEQVAKFADAFADIFEVIAGENAQKVTEDILAIFINPLMSVIETLGQFRNDIFALITQPIIDSKEQIKESLDGVLGNFSVFTGSVRTVFTDLFSMLNGFYSTYISPVFEKLIPKLTELVQQHLLPMVEAFGGMFELLGTGIMFLWQELLMPLFMWLEETFGPIISMWLETLATGFIDAIGFIMDAIKLLMDGGLVTLINYITDKFSINWTKAWQGIANTFVGIWNKILDAIEWVINGAIRAINKLIDAANSVASAIGLPTISNIDSIELPRAKIPFLATGAVIPPNAPFMAMLGDQKHGTNLEAPEDLIRQIVREEAGGSREMLDLLMQIAQNTRDTADKDLTIGDREIARANLRGQREMGYTLITEG